MSFATKREYFAAGVLILLTFLQGWQYRRLRELKREVLSSIECQCETEYR